MFEADNDLKHDLECLRLASDFMWLSRSALSANLQAHCIEMAKYWSEEAGGGRATDVVNPNDSD